MTEVLDRFEAGWRMDHLISDLSSSVYAAKEETSDANADDVAEFARTLIAAHPDLVPWANKWMRGIDSVCDIEAADKLLAQLILAHGEGRPAVFHVQNGRVTRCWGATHPGNRRRS